MPGHGIHIRKQQRNPPMGLKLNLGSGQNPQPGFVNVDKFGEPDLRCDLETFPWPWPDNSVSEIVMNHVLEHLGASTEVFIGIMKELYRVCEPGARIRIAVPHPRHDTFINDPTHVRPITPEVLSLFSKRQNLRWKETGAANSPLALYHGVDFEVVSEEYFLDEPYSSDLQQGRLEQDELKALLRKHNNVASEISITLQAVKS
jgi:hypothetical protein